MKKQFSFVAVLASLVLASCASTTPSASTTTKPSTPNSDSTSTVSPSDTTPSESTPSETTPSESTPSTPIIDKFNITGSVSNFVDGKLEGVKVLLNELEVTTDNTGNFAFNDYEKLAQNKLTVSKEGYETYTTTIDELLVSKDVTLGDIELMKTYVLVGALEGKSWPNYEAFNMTTTRNSTSLKVRLNSNNKVFGSEGRASKAEIYISVKDVISGRDVNTYQVGKESNGNVFSHNYGNLPFNEGVSADYVELETTSYIEYTIPFDKLGINSDAIIGLTAGMWSEVDKDWAPMISAADGALALVENPVLYVRNDKNNTVFSSPLNCYPEDVPTPDYDKDELIKDHPINVANPEHNKFAAVADDIYIKTALDETGINFDMVGFGEFTDSEYIKMILHTSDTNGGGWALQSDDLTMLVGKNRATKKTNLTNFWDYVNYGEGDVETANAPHYVLDETGYFTLDFKVNFDEIPGYTSEGKISLLAIEFDNGNIYEGLPPDFGMMNNGAPIGDPANQGSYVIIKEKDTGVDKDALTEGHNIEFSMGADHIYTKVEKTETNLKLHFVSFNSFDDTDYIRFICQTDANPSTEVWGLKESDVSFSIYKNKAFFQTGKTSFWDGEPNQFHGEDETLNTPTYTLGEEGKYWTLTLEIDYSELSLAANKDTAMRGLFIEFTSGGIQNNGFKQDGEVKGDMALQSNYFTF